MNDGDYPIASLADAAAVREADPAAVREADPAAVRRADASRDPWHPPAARPPDGATGHGPV